MKVTCNYILRQEILKIIADCRDQIHLPGSDV
jgi:hypothetical protein